LERLRVLYRDSHVAVVNKPSGLSVHRGWDRERDTALSRLRDALGQQVHPVHRLDRGTSGCLVFALERDLIAPLQATFASREIEKVYVALVRGIVEDAGRIEHPIQKENGERVSAITDYRRLGTFERYSLVEARPRTGRIHQIRRHFKHLSHPLIGDVRYGKGEHNRAFRERFDLRRLALHATRVGFQHPARDEHVCVDAPFTSDLSAPLRAMGFELSELTLG
jgi:tRNA pseudouridine65 synthase